MKTTVVGPVLDELGQAMTRAYAHDRHGAPTTIKRHWSTPAGKVRRIQAETIPIDWRHDQRAIGKVVHLELRGRHLWAVGEIDGEIQAPGYDLFWSSEATHRNGDDVVLEWLSLTPAPAQTGLLPLQFLAGDLRYRGASRRWNGSELDSVRRATLERAEQTYFERRMKRVPLVVHDAERDRDLDRHFHPHERYMLDDAAREDLSDLFEKVGPIGAWRYRPSAIIGVR